VTARTGDWLQTMAAELKAVRDGPCHCPALHAVTGTCPETAQTAVQAGDATVRMCRSCAVAERDQQARTLR
jgi:hypothetical protein